MLYRRRESCRACSLSSRGAVSLSDGNADYGDDGGLELSRRTSRCVRFTSALNADWNAGSFR